MATMSYEYSEDNLIETASQEVLEELGWQVEYAWTHETFGEDGFQEVIYQRCLAIELEKAGLGYAREQEHVIYYEGIEVGTRRADFVVEDQVIVELKALVQLEDVHLAQAKNYVVAYDKPIGLLINFGGRSLQFKKIYNPKYNQDNPKIR